MPELEPPVDMVLTDPPYGITRNNWDSTINLDLLWRCYKRITKANSAVVLTSMPPFTSILVMSNLEWFKYELIWEKSKSTGFLDCRYRPLRSHENILVFYDKKPTYNPQKTIGKPWVRGRTKRPKSNWGEQKENYSINKSGLREPRSVIKISNPNNKSLHPTQKPVELFTYLINTYTNVNDLVLDSCAGSGTLGVACEKLASNTRMLGVVLLKRKN